MILEQRFWRDGEAEREDADRELEGSAVFVSKKIERLTGIPKRKPAGITTG